MGLDSKVKFNHATAEEATKRRGYIHGMHFGVVTGVDKQMSKGKPETGGAQWKMLVLNIKPVSDPSDLTSVVGRGIKRYVCLPFWDEEWDSFEEQYQKKISQNINGPFTQGTHETLAALLPDEVPLTPRKNDAGVYEFQGEEIAADEYRDKQKEAYAAAGDVAERLWNDGAEELIEKGCYILIGADPKGKSDFDQLLKMSPVPLKDRESGEEMSLEPEIEGVNDSSSTSDADAESGGEVSPKNGAAGKPKASAKTVAAAAAAKKGAQKSGKGARR